MNDNKLDLLLKTDDNSTISLNTSEHYTNTKRSINSICKALCLETKDYFPQKTVENIQAYLESSDKIDRILYSEISSFVFSLDIPSRGAFATNLEKLLLHALNSKEPTISSDCRKIIIKIYDHFQLALLQIENANHIFANSIEDAKINLQAEIKGIEKEHISILGIFAAIVLAFVGGITFSSSVLQNIEKASIFRILIIVDFLAFVLINVIYILIRFIAIINEKEHQLFKIRYLNKFCLFTAILILIAWILHIPSFADFISRFLPWCILSSSFFF